VNQPRGTTLSQREIEQLVTDIASGLGGLSAPNADFAGFAAVGERLRRLRAQYQTAPRSLDGHLPKLTQFSRQFDALLDARLVQVVDRFHQVNEQIRQAESEKEFLREFLIREAGAGKHIQFSGLRADVLIRSSHSRLLPPAETDARTQLERLIQEAGCWPDVSQLSRAKLQRALDEQRFNSVHQQAISQLCPVTVLHHVSSRARGSPF
jgi:hypothetical protein